MTVARNGQIVGLVFRILEDHIADGTYSPSLRLTQTQVAQDLSVSRTPLREAFQRLERKGLVVTEANRGVVVAPSSVSDVENSYGVRILVEPHALATTIPVVTGDDIAQMGAALWATSRDNVSTTDFQLWHKKYHDVLLRKYPLPFADLMPIADDTYRPASGGVPHSPAPARRCHRGRPHVPRGHWIRIHRHERWTLPGSAAPRRVGIAAAPAQGTEHHQHPRRVAHATGRSQRQHERHP